MEYRKLGRTKIKISVLGIGGGAFYGNEKGPDLVKKIIKFGFDNGINFVETAEDYGEQKLAPALQEIKDSIVISSKSFSSNKSEMKKSIDNSLNKMGVEKVDIYMMHTVDTKSGLDFRLKNGVLDALKEAKSDGKIDWIGISGHRVPTLIEAIKTNEFDVVEVPHCIECVETEKLFEYTKEYDIGVITIRAFGGGILVDRNNPRLMEFMNPKNALSYVLSNKNISSVLVGMSSIEHFMENLEALKHLNISEPERREIGKKVIGFLGNNFCRGCLACMPCDVHGWKFSIDQFLRMDVFFSNYKMTGIKDEYNKMELKADKCVECGKCEVRCPYGVSIVEKLKNLHKMMS